MIILLKNLNALSNVYALTINISVKKGCVVIDLYADVITEITDYFHTIDSNFNIANQSPSVTYNDESSKMHMASDLLERLITFKKRHLTSMPRNIFYSREIKQTLADSDDTNLNAVVNSIGNDLRNGTDINGRLSKLADKIGTNDAMLYEWNLYHFHLGRDKELHNNYYYRRTGQLLIAYIPNPQTSVYFVDISDNHSDNIVFSKKQYLTIIDNNWPDLLSRYEIKGIQGLSFEPTDTERRDLRNAGVSVMEHINNKFIFSPGGGQTTAGTSTSCRIAADKIINYIYEIKKLFKNRQRNFIPKQIPEWINFKLRLNQNNYYFSIIETNPQKGNRIIGTIHL